MSNWHLRFGAVVAASLAAIGLTAAPASAAEARHLTGELADGSTWVADVPGAWNGTTILFSHGFGPLIARDAPDDATAQALLGKGYALVGSSYSGPSLWALKSAVKDQFGALQALEGQVGASRRVIAWGASMGGLVSSLEAEDPGGHIDGALTTCGLVAGGLNLSNYQLDGQYALSHLLAPGQPIKLVRFASAAEATDSAQSLVTLTSQAQSTPAGRARTALAATLMHEPTWSSGPAAPAPGDYEAQVQQQAAELSWVLGFVVGGRYQVELEAGGNGSFNAGVDYRALLATNGNAKQVRALYKTAGLDLDADLATLTRDANIKADPQAVTTLLRTSTPTGELRVPELNVHTVADQLVPVEQENWYARRVREAGRAPLLSQAYLNVTGHCNFQPSETIAALHALEARIDTGHWRDVAEPDRLNAAADALGAPGHYARFTPAKLSGGLGEPGRFHA